MQIGKHARRDRRRLATGAPKEDFAALLRGLIDPETSLIALRPTGKQVHQTGGSATGGKRRGRTRDDFDLVEFKRRQLEQAEGARLRAKERKTIDQQSGVLPWCAVETEPGSVKQPTLRLDPSP